MTAEELAALECELKLYGSSIPKFVVERARRQKTLSAGFDVLLAYFLYRNPAHEGNPQ